MAIITLVPAAGAREMIALREIPASPVEIAPQELATPEHGGAAADFWFVLLGQLRPSADTEQCFDLGFADYQSGNESSEGQTARPSVVSHCSAPKRPLGRASLWRGGERERPSSGGAGADPKSVAAAAVQEALRALPEGGDRNPDVWEPNRGPRLLPDGEERQHGTSAPAVSPESPLSLSQVVLAEIRVGLSPPLTSPDSAWFAPTLDTEPGSLMPPLARAGGHNAMATPPARAPTTAGTNGDEVQALGSPEQAPASALAEPGPPRARAVPGASSDESGGAKPAPIPASAGSEESVSSPALASPVTVRREQGSAQAEARAVPMIGPRATTDVVVMSAAAADDTLSARPAPELDRAPSPRPAATVREAPSARPDPAADETPSPRFSRAADEAPSPRFARAADEAPSPRFSRGADEALSPRFSRAADEALSPRPAAPTDGVPLARRLEVSGRTPASGSAEPAVVDSGDSQAPPRVGAEGEAHSSAAPRGAGAPQESNAPRRSRTSSSAGRDALRDPETGRGEASGERRPVAVSFPNRRDVSRQPMALTRGEEEAEAPAALRTPEVEPAGARLVTAEARNAGRTERVAGSDMRPTHVEASALLEQIEGGTRNAIRFSRVTVQLRPPELGTIQIAVQSREGSLSVHFQASHPMVSAWLESNAVTLRSELADSGLPFQNLSFATTAHEHSGQGTGERQEAPHDGASFGPEAKASARRGGPAAGTQRGVAEWRA